MSKRIDLFDSTYGHFSEQVMDAIRKETFGRDIEPLLQIEGEERFESLQQFLAAVTNHVPGRKTRALTWIATDSGPGS